MPIKYLFLFITILISIYCIAQKSPTIMELDIKQYKLEGRNNYDHEAEGKSVIQNLLLQCFINNQMGRKQEFFNDMYQINVQQLKEDGYSFYWPNDINMDFSMREIDEHNTKILRDLISTYGFPAFNDLNELEIKGIFLTLYYSNDINIISKYKNKFLEFYTNFKYPPKYYAYLTDKLNYLNGKQQTYGTFLIVSEDGSKQAQMIKNEKELNSRRKEIGLETYEEWQQSEDYKRIGERMRLREAWYRDYYNKTRTAD